jgi:hypothetical protein
MSTRDDPNTPAEVQPPDIGVDLELASLNAHIAAELAAGLSDPPAIRERYGISEEQWRMLAKNKAFRSMVAEAIQNFKGDMNAGARITMKAEIILEDSIPVLDQIIHNPQITPQARIEAIKELRTLSGRTGKDSGTSVPGGGFTLNINIGNGERLVIPAQPVRPAIEHE